MSEIIDQAVRHQDTRRSAVAIGSGRQRYARRENSLRRKTRIEMLHVDRAAEEERRAGQQREREWPLRHRSAASACDPWSAAPLASPPFTQRLLQIASPNPERREQAADERAGEGDASHGE